MGRLKRRWRKRQAQRESAKGITQNYWNSLKAEQEEKEMQQLQKNMDRVGWTMLVVAGVLMLAIIWIQVGKWYGW